ncbi:FAD-binding oxidoreductase [uncultured Litoreibacter sp.]|uniref:NAD(P)/FAD-dependent oxidoreductase n=1 Tax=uncultured Litoreibacter sp. TaxID=1392394 RepID=UPI0026109B9D|nr:FAD-binding oxidoreductase [uncultured Litoreibacter sp.]
MINSPVKEEIHWTVTAEAAPECQQLDSSIDVDVLVVGAGLTGCRTALGLAEAGVSVALVDSQEIGWGSSGRSGGQCNPIWRQTPQKLIDMLGETHGARLIQTTLTAADDLFGDIERFGVQCDAVQNGWIQAAHTKKARTNLRALGSSWAAAGLDIQEIEGDAVRDASGSPAYAFALRHAAGGHVQPLSLTRGYARAAIERGAHAFQRTPITNLERIDGKWKAASTNGQITAENVVLTTNGYSKGAWPDLEKTFHGLFSVALATQPLTEAQQAEILPGKVTISDSRLAIYFARYDRDGRLIFGCVGSSERVDHLGGFHRVKRGLKTVFPQIADIPVERKWAGRIAVTPEMMPHIHEPAPGITAGIGFSGRGIAMTSVMGRALSAKLLGTQAGDLPFPIQPVTPIPFHGITSHLIPFAAPAMTLRDRFETLTDGI